VKLSKITPAPDPSAAAIAAHRELAVAVGDRGPGDRRRIFEPISIPNFYPCVTPIIYAPTGWCWLAVKDGKIVVMKMPNGENPLVPGGMPILG
jgi:hypothetical protein